MRGSEWIQENGKRGIEDVKAGVEKPFEDCNGRVRQREIRNQGIFFFTMPYYNMLLEMIR